MAAGVSISSIASAIANLGVGAFIGAIVGALATYLLSEYRDNRLRKRELMGLARLIDNEISLNGLAWREKLEAAWPKCLTIGPATPRPGLFPRGKLLQPVAAYAG
jgi:hypothetical protein